MYQFTALPLLAQQHIDDMHQQAAQARLARAVRGNYGRRRWPHKGRTR